MKSTDLRIGNYYNCYGIPKKVSAEFILRLSEIEKKERTAVDVSDIPLTEEWLLKFGNAIKGRFPNGIDIYDRFRFIWKEAYKYWYVITIGSKEYLTKIEFVHEYQNFIHTLTGEELTIKE